MDKAEMRSLREFGRLILKAVETIDASPENVTIADVAAYFLSEKYWKETLQPVVHSKELAEKGVTEYENVVVELIESTLPEYKERVEVETEFVDTFRYFMIHLNLDDEREEGLWNSIIDRIKTGYYDNIKHYYHVATHVPEDN